MIPKDLQYDLVILKNIMLNDKSKGYPDIDCYIQRLDEIIKLTE